MRIRRISIQNFRKLTEPVTINGFSDGLTVVAGDNEEGKSTVLTAVQTVFFSRHRISGKAAQAMQPYGSAVRPEIAIDFDLDGNPYSLRKAFCQKPEAELVTSTGRFSGDAAEDWLNELLRFEAAKDGSKPEHRGVWGLFWVEQGTSFARPKLGPSGHETLADALESEVGQVLGGERGRALLTAITQKRDEYFTKPGKPRGRYNESLEDVRALETELEELRSSLRLYDGKIDDLGRIRGRLKTYEDDHALATAEQDLKQAHEDSNRVGSLQSALVAAETNEKLATAEWKTALQSWSAREERMKSATTANAEASACLANAKKRGTNLAKGKADKDKAESVFGKAKLDLGRAEAVLSTCERDLLRARILGDLKDLAERLNKAKESKQQGDALRTEAAGIRIDEAEINRLRALEKAADMARIRLQTIATRLEFFPEPNRKALLGDRPLSPEEPLLLTEKADLSLEGFGALTVTPGGEDLSSRRGDSENATDKFEKALKRLGVADLASAEKRLKKRVELLTKAGNHDAAAAAHAPNGVDFLVQEIDQKNLQLKELSEGTGEPAPPIKEAERYRDEACVKFDEARGILDRTEKELKTAEKLHSEIREAWVKAQAELEGAERRSERLQEELESERVESSDEDLRMAVEAATGKYEYAKSMTAQRRTDLENANPEEVRLRLERAEQAVKSITADIEKLARQANDLEVELRTLGQIGLGEQLEEKEGELARARAAADRMGRNAAAVRLLLDTLTAAEREAKETFLGPVRERIKPYLRLLFPDAELVLDDGDMAISHLRRDGFDEPFDSLSVGTREQLAVLTRLAFADFLRDKGRPAAIILDDALAYSDDQRFDRMQLVLRKAAERLQVIILTCRERDYHALGAPIVRLSDCGAL